MKLDAQGNNSITIEGKIGLRTAESILKKWECNDEQIQHILSLNKPVKIVKDSSQITDEQLLRISYILNIHACLRTLFDNPKNVYEFMSLKNNNSYFNGSSPLDIVLEGNINSLAEVYQQIEALTFS